MAQTAPVNNTAHKKTIDDKFKEKEERPNLYIVPKKRPDEDFSGSIYDSQKKKYPAYAQEQDYDFPLLNSPGLDMWAQKPSYTRPCDIPYSALIGHEELANIGHRGGYMDFKGYARGVQGGAGKGGELEILKQKGYEIFGHYNFSISFPDFGTVRYS